MISLIDSLLRNDVLGAFVGSKVAARWYLVVVWFIHSLMIRFCCISSLSHRMCIEQAFYLLIKYVFAQ